MKADLQLVWQRAVGETHSANYTCLSDAPLVCFALVDQASVELFVRVTARLSAAIFAAALLVFATGYHHNRRRLHLGARLLAGFIAAHTIHFATVAWLAVVTAGENIRERDGWAIVATVALLFYTAAFVLLRVWGDAALGRSSSRGLRVAANVAVVAIAAVFVNSYLARVARMPVYWLPAVALAAMVAVFFINTRGAALPSVHRQRSGTDAGG